MNNQTLIFKKDNRIMEQKCGDNYPIEKHTIIALMKKCGWELWRVKG